LSLHFSVAKYQEANPTVFTIVTFPFLFAVMFGDWGHGICLLIATMYLVLREKKLSSQVMSLIGTIYGPTEHSIRLEKFQIVCYMLLFLELRANVQLNIIQLSI